MKTRGSCLTSLPGNTAGPDGSVAGSRLRFPVNTHGHTRAPRLTHVFLSVLTGYHCVTCSLVFRVVGLGGIQGQGLNTAWLGCGRVREGGPGGQGTVRG